jgi:TonB family protein
MDSRTLVPSNLPQFELDPKSSIPSYFKLEVLGAPVVVPRDNMPNTPLDATSKTPDYVPLTILDSRVAVPKDAHASKIEHKELTAIQDLPDLIDPDVLTTGEVNLMARPVEAQTDKWNALAQVCAVALELIVVAFILYGPGLPQARNQAEIARNNVTDLYLPNNLDKLLKSPEAPRPRSPQMRVDPRLLRQLAPPREVQPQPNPPEPEHVVRDNPATKPLAPMAPRTPQPLEDSPIKPLLTPPPDTSTSSIVLPRFSPGKALQDSMHQALKDGGTAGADFGGGTPSGGGGIGGGGGGGGGQGLGGSLQMLTPTEGVDFSTYLARVLASVKRNWESVMPESARLGDRGRVTLQFRIMRNGVVPEAEPSMVGSSGKDPLDRAAVSSIRASTPFEPLPSAFSGPYIELRFIFLYNIPLSAAQ